MPASARPRIARRPFLVRLGAVVVAPFVVTRTARATETPTQPLTEPPTQPMTAFIGQIALMPYNFVPRGWALCNGQELAINDFAALFSVLGTNFGGDGRRTFRVPSMKPPYRGVRYMICTEHGTFPTRV